MREAAEYEGEGEPSAWLSAQAGGISQQRQDLQPAEQEAQQFQRRILGDIAGLRKRLFTFVDFLFRAGAVDP